MSSIFVVVSGWVLSTIFPDLSISFCIRPSCKLVSKPGASAVSCLSVIFLNFFAIPENTTLVKIIPVTIPSVAAAPKARMLPIVRSVIPTVLMLTAPVSSDLLMSPKFVTICSIIFSETVDFLAAPEYI